MDNVMLPVKSFSMTSLVVGHHGGRPLQAGNNNLAAMLQCVLGSSWFTIVPGFWW